MPVHTFQVRAIPGNPFEIKIAGAITENADFSRMLIPDGAPLRIDLAHITAFNSVGIREWRNWTAELVNEKIVFYNCPRTFIDQLNMVTHFIPDRARIESFYVPYYSEETDEEKQVLFTSGVEFTIAEGNAVIRWPSVKDSIGELMEIDVMESRYFRFLPVHGL